MQINFIEILLSTQVIDTIDAIDVPLSTPLTQLRDNVIFPAIFRSAGSGATRSVDSVCSVGSGHCVHCYRGNDKNSSRITVRLSFSIFNYGFLTTTLTTVFPVFARRLKFEGFLRERESE